MKIIPSEQYPQRDQKALFGFLTLCQEQAAKRGRPVLASIALKVRHIDPLAVLQSIYEQGQLHFYLENSQVDEAIAGAEAVLSATFEGEDRFAGVQSFIRQSLDDAIAIGDMDAPFSGPHFFCAFTFASEAEQGECSGFAPATVFVPRWQVARHSDGYTAVANILVSAQTNLRLETARVLAAHSKFLRFDYAQGTTGASVAGLPLAAGGPVTRTSVAAGDSAAGALAANGASSAGTSPDDSLGGASARLASAASVTVSSAAGQGTGSSLGAPLAGGVSAASAAGSHLSSATSPYVSAIGAAGGAGDSAPSCVGNTAAHTAAHSEATDGGAAHSGPRETSTVAVHATGGTPEAAGSNTPSEVGGQGHYTRAVAEALLRIASGKYEKIVLARMLDLHSARPLHPLEALNRLRERYPSCYAFSFANGRGQSFIGSSPERLLRVQGGKIQTEALAGSAPRSASAGEDARLGSELLHNDKDLREHELVRAAIVADLLSLGVRLDALPSGPRLRKLANLQHLWTPLGGTLPAGCGLLDIASLLHPTPAVGGVPRTVACKDVAELEAAPRGLYTGALGWVDARGEGEMVVALRSGLIDGNRARLYAGAGIVEGSDPQLEHSETELKFRPLLNSLQAASANRS